eukprot:CAMPEP_0176192542 /NCGR_PEP_ID=MMETSP0121_2-20121125/5026_1 /TAXON_ID=160619 /ORGANISM="Kryptoperidinium foliaceum, Strain CCMP 1326" /LENGTH=245 /DNA_ID=CAMNT_0017531235 /DNA_START=44 /DNA_END=779 /DNA_ORIENTATION=+
MVLQGAGRLTAMWAASLALCRPWGVAATRLPPMFESRRVLGRATVDGTIERTFREDFAGMWWVTGGEASFRSIVKAVSLYEVFEGAGVQGTVPCAELMWRSLGGPISGNSAKLEPKLISLAGEVPRVCITGFFELLGLDGKVELAFCRRDRECWLDVVTRQTADTRALTDAFAMTAVASTSLSGGHPVSQHVDSASLGMEAAHADSPAQYRIVAELRRQEDLRSMYGPGAAWQAGLDEQHRRSAD